MFVYVIYFHYSEKLAFPFFYDIINIEGKLSNEKSFFAKNTPIKLAADACTLQLLHIS